MAGGIPGPRPRTPANVAADPGPRYGELHASPESSAPGDSLDAADGHCEVLLDGGINSGQDVLKALASGARACLIGKAFLYGLAARGGAGVSLALQILRKELEISMALCGENDVRNVGRHILVSR